MKHKQMTCDVCGKKAAVVQKLNRTYGRGRDVLIIENVPVVSCEACGESYLTAETMHEIERLKLHRRELAEDRKVSAIRFTA
jgi:YgiT-type zinc finger domain-containing protein